MADAAIAGLLARQKFLPCWLFYDERGSELFERITDLAEYYPTRTEQRILEEAAASIVERSAQGQSVTLVELGAGSAKKTELILAALLKQQPQVDFCAIDIASAPLKALRERLRITFPAVNVTPRVTTHEDSFRFIRALPGRKLVLFIGSSIGNFDAADGVKLLRGLQNSLNPGDCLLLGTDLRKSTGTMLRAYDDSGGVTAAFNMNILLRLNRELGGNFEPRHFKHVALWNESASRIEMHLESLLSQTITLRAPQISIRFRQGERIHTESCYKFDSNMTMDLLSGAGFTLDSTFVDDAQFFAVHLARVPERARLWRN